jgi:hypothetical protein
MTQITEIARTALAVLVLGTILAGQQKPFPVISTVDAPTIAGHPVQLDSKGKLLPWPMPDDTGYSYSSHVLCGTSTTGSVYLIFSAVSTMTAPRSN